MTDEPKTQREQHSERGQLITKGLRTDDGSVCTLLLVHEADGAWTIRGPGVPGVTLPKLEMVALATAILVHTR